jgi:hypothetical protein
MNNKIFIQIASYRDPELIPTIKDCIKNADNPDNLTFGICWQHDENELLTEFMNDKRFKIISIHYSQSKGCCWARHKIQQLYNDEDYTLQLDSHHRFIQGWDTILINMFKKLKEKGVSKPLITAYLPSYNPENDPKERVLIPWKINFKEITNDKQVLCIPSNIDNFNMLSEPIIANFYSAHFSFTSGNFVKDVPHDPELYFTGEEMSITIRAYTYGYTLFHPHILIAWHEYTRKNRNKHWDDHKEWWKMDKHSKEHYLSIFENKGLYGIGTEKTIENYIQFSGIHFLDGNIEKNSNIDGNIHCKTDCKIENNSNTENDCKIENDCNTENNSKIENNCKIENNYKVFDNSWTNWVKENIELGIPKETIFEILLKANFNPIDIDKQLNFYTIN